MLQVIIPTWHRAEAEQANVPAWAKLDTNLRLLKARTNEKVKR